MNVKRFIGFAPGRLPSVFELVVEAAEANDIKLFCRCFSRRQNKLTCLSLSTILKTRLMFRFGFRKGHLTAGYQKLSIVLPPNIRSYSNLLSVTMAPVYSFCA